MSELVPNTSPLLTDLRSLIDTARTRVVVAVNREQTLLSWDLGKRLREELLHETRAPYGQQIVSTVSKQLTEDFGSGYSRQNLFRMIQVAEYFPDRAVVEQVSDIVSWRQFRASQSEAERSRAEKPCPASSPCRSF